MEHLITREICELDVADITYWSLPVASGRELWFWFCFSLGLRTLLKWSREQSLRCAVFIPRPSLLAPEPHLINEPFTRLFSSLLRESKRSDMVHTQGFLAFSRS